MFLSSEICRISTIFIVLFASSVLSETYKWPVNDELPEKWINDAKSQIDKMLTRKLNNNIAKNLIMFLGDGMGISTITAGRIRKGQIKKHSGEEEITYMESLENIALAKTYNIDAQTPDSAGTATAYLCGVKTGVSIIGLNGQAKLNNCTSSLNANADSILKWAYKAGKRVGVVTTTRITHASPAAAYAHVPSRYWESYNNIKFTSKEKNEGCTDIASQLIDNNAFINVIFGGGRKQFLPVTSQDYDNSTKIFGTRVDGRHLINEWINKMENDNKRHKFVWNAKDFRKIDPNNYDHVLGLFNYDHMNFEVERNDNKEPSLVEMTEMAIKILEKSKNGYFLFVEGGRIDHGHHQSKAHKALDEFVVFDNSIGKALSMTSEDDTQIVVTADHSHTFSVGGFGKRGEEILGVYVSPYAGTKDENNLTFTSLAYANGPGGILRVRTRNLTAEETTKPDYIQEAAFYLSHETHGAEDVAIFARGPMGHLFDGTVEQSYIPHAMAYSACIGPLYENEKCKTQRSSSKSNQIYGNLGFTILAFVFAFVYK